MKGLQVRDSGAVTMVDFRQDAARVLRRLRGGQRLTLTYRGKAVARLEPIRPAANADADDPLFCLADGAIDCPLGPLDHDAIDGLLYVRP